MHAVSSVFLPPSDRWRKSTANLGTISPIRVPGLTGTYMTFHMTPRSALATGYWAITWSIWTPTAHFSTAPSRLRCSMWRSGTTLPNTKALCSIFERCTVPLCCGTRCPRLIPCPFAAQRGSAEPCHLLSHGVRLHRRRCQRLDRQLTDSLVRLYSSPTS